MKTIYELQQIANRLRQVMEVNSISPEDTFGLQSDVLEYLADMEQNAEGLGIHKVYASYAAMVADASSPVGSNGKALRFGQLVVICNPSNTIQEENGNIYAWQKGNAGDAAWLLIGNLGSVLGNPQNGYYVCDTAAATAEKEISATSYVLYVGGSMKVKMTNANTADNATLNINSTGVKALYYAGERASSINTWEAGETVEVYYDGTSYYANNVAGGSGSGDGAFDVSAKYPTSGVDGSNTYTLGGALAVLNANLSANKKKGGMSIKFIQSSDNKYVQYRLMADDWSTTVADWQGVEETPTPNSDSIVKSGGIHRAIFTSFSEELNTAIIQYKYLTDTGTYSSSTSSRYAADENFYKIHSEYLIVYNTSINSATIKLCFYKSANQYSSSFLRYIEISLNKFAIINLPKDAQYYRIGVISGAGIDVSTIISSTNLYIKDEFNTYAMIFSEDYAENGTITYTNDTPSSFNVVWADNTPGVYTATDWDSVNHMYLGYEISYGTTLKVVQPSVTVNDGKITNIPVKTIVSIS